MLRRGATPPPRELIVAPRVRRRRGRAGVRAARVASRCWAGACCACSTSTRGSTLAACWHCRCRCRRRATTLERVVSFYSALQSALEERLGPGAIAIVNEIPLTGSVRPAVSCGVRPGDAGREAVVREAGPAYFDVMRIPVVAGRSFDPRDNASAPPRVVISESLAERLFALEPPIGRQIWLAADSASGRNHRGRRRRQAPRTR